MNFNKEMITDISGVNPRKGMNHLSEEAIPELLDPELPQQAIVSAFRKYKR